MSGGPARRGPGDDHGHGAVSRDAAHDVAGIGIGPFNLSLAALADGLDLDAVFLDEQQEFSWHPGLMLPSARLQVPFLADLVTLVDPTSRWSFLSYLREHDRLFPFYFSERFHPSRREYDDYCRWAARTIPSCRFGQRVERVSWDAAEGRFLLEHTGADGGTQRVRARNVVVGIGTRPVVPPALEPLLGRRAFHAADYVHRLPELDGAREITVVGSGQSGAEVFLDLLQRAPGAGWRITWLTNSPAFAPMEYSKLGLEHFTPDYVRFFRGLPEETRDRLLPEQWQLYKAISADTIADIHDLLYDRSTGGADPGAVLTPAVTVLSGEPDGDGFVLRCRHDQQGREWRHRTDAVVLATGYGKRDPQFLEPLEPLIRRDAHGRFQVDADYRVALDPQVTGSLFVQNAEHHTHGVGTPDLGLGAWRSARILNAVTTADGREPVFRLPEVTAFTRFGAPPGHEGDADDAGTAGPAADRAEENSGENSGENGAGSDGESSAGSDGESSAGSDGESGRGPAGEPPRRVTAGR